MHEACCPVILMDCYLNKVIQALCTLLRSLNGTAWHERRTIGNHSPEEAYARKMDGELGDAAVTSWLPMSSLLNVVALLTWSNG